jgi:hypothetical protein
LAIKAAKHHASNYEDGINQDAAINLEDVQSSLPKIDKE